MSLVTWFFQTRRRVFIAGALQISALLLTLGAPLCHAKDIVIGQVAALLNDPRHTR
jgi:hypothetical protein